MWNAQHIHRKHFLFAWFVWNLILFPSIIIIRSKINICSGFSQKYWLALSIFQSLWYFPIFIEMPANKGFERKCEICRRDNYNGRMLGPLIHTKTISAHYNCVMFSPVTPDETSRRDNPNDDAIAGVTARFIREEGGRAKQLVRICFLLWIFSMVLH